MRRTLVTGLLALGAAGGCGDSTQEQAAASAAPAVEQPATVPTTPEQAARQHSRQEKEASEAAIRRAQGRTAGPDSAQLEQVEQLRDVRQRPVRAGKATAPAGALSVARAAASQWLAYRIEGVAPKRRDLARLTRGVPPMSEELRRQGSARRGGLVAFAANRSKGRWVIHVATQDARLATIIAGVELADAGRYVVEEINAG